ncbi:hypothetical protein GJ496_009539 [Pomphorhynchus laevis]|nr:hypothetical protein GJ496_009539 [Pomphorhynchus laevis]
MRFTILIVWREPNNHGDNWYFCAHNLNGVNRNNQQTLIYPNLASANRPIQHSEELPVPSIQCLALAKFILKRRRFLT